MNNEPVRLADLPPKERRLVLGAALALPVTVLLLHLFSFKRMMRWLARSARRNGGAEGGARLERATRIADLVQLANHRYSPLAASCLPRSLTLSWLLGRRGIDNELHIGVRTRRGRIQAHAWVEVEGRPLAETEDVRREYAAFDPPSRIAPRLFD